MSNVRLIFRLKKQMTHYINILSLDYQLWFIPEEHGHILIVHAPEAKIGKSDVKSIVFAFLIV